MFTDKSIRIFQFVAVFLAFSSHHFTSGKAVSTSAGNEVVQTPSNAPATNKPQPMTEGPQLCSQGFGQHRTQKGNFSIKADLEVSTPCQTKKSVFMCLPSSCRSQDKKPHVFATGCEGSSGPTQCLSYAFKPEIPAKSFGSSPIPVQSSKAPRPITRRAAPEKKEQTFVVKAPLECVTSATPPKTVGCQKLESVMECTKCQILV
ncbi:uncharacterized protein MELLADRAFT_92256 [Melampsora larici-populina 98AG31]|uniref:Secreted protein n=1 Tax=Melampsora larici-populina (strain 98AG31 / pathotype 3-4-7) TaxID=747676 RepID=F4R8Z2_MELLP|nr:uncharacterized protein MELLADRAFT_92256 [Melampsora larici-populina 98AG31]EGG10895.1 secreted protein [Melampsora larici-populina 98AG31]